MFGISDLQSAGVRLHLSGAPAGGIAVLLVGLSSSVWAGGALPVSLQPIGFAGCELATSAEVQLPLTVGTAGLRRGYTSFDVPFALTPDSSQLLQGQWLVLGGGAAAPGATTNSISWAH